MAGRPKKKEEKPDIAAVEEKARKEGKTYGQLQAEKQAKEVKVQQSDGVKRASANQKPSKIPFRSLKRHKDVILEIEEEISVHEGCIKTQKEEIEMRQGCIKTHEEAIEVLQAELNEEKEFLEAYSD